MTIQGFLLQKYETEQVSEKFKKRQLVIKTEETYPQTIPLQLTQDKCGLLDRYKIGDKIKASINIRGNKWVNPQGETRYFASLEVWKLETIDGSDNDYIEPVTAEPKMSDYKVTGSTLDNNDDLPF